MDQVFAEAIVPRSFRCLGRDLVPLTVGHHALLDILDSPFITGAPVSVGDVVVGVYLCSLPFSAARARLADRRRTTAECKTWGRRAGRTFDGNRAAATFRRYIEHFTKQPELFVGERSGAVRAPLTFALLYILQSTYAMSEGDAWNLPMNEALCRAATVQDMTGIAEIVSDYDKLLGDRAAALQAKIDALVQQEAARGT